ncbi:MAG TPA: hypothetical protein VGO16_19840 [Pseudonocardiaceae bacterium]|jgi:hypothetical protein|nr:hypothetical protein [Pseudonocardiaceae bacterium]
MDGHEPEPAEPSAAEWAAIEAELPDEQRLAVRDFWEHVIAECRAEVADAPRPTSWLVASAAEQRHIRREARRVAVAAVRALPVRRTPGPSGSEAA